MIKPIRSHEGDRSLLNVSMMYILMKANTSRLQKSYSIQPLRSPIRNKAPRLENLLQKSPISRKIGKFNKSSISKKKSSIKKTSN